MIQIVKYCFKMFFYQRQLLTYFFDNSSINFRKVNRCNLFVYLMEKKLIKRKIIANKVFFSTLLIVFLYLMLFLIQSGNNTLISSYIPSTVIMIIDGFVALALIIETILVIKFNNFNWEKLIIPLFIFASYCAYLLIYNIGFAHDSLEIIISNIKTVGIMALFGYNAIYIIPNIINKKTIKLFMIIVITLSASACVYFAFTGVPEIIKDFLNEDNFYFGKSFFTNKNTFAYLMVVSIFCLTYLSVIERKKWLFYVSLFYVPFIILCFAKTAIVITFIYYFVLLAFAIKKSDNKWLKRSFVYIIVAIIFFIVLFVLGVFKGIALFDKLYNYFYSMLYSTRTLSLRVEEFVKSFQGMNYGNIFMGVGFASGEQLIAKFTSEAYFHMAYHQNLICGGIVLVIIKFLLIIWLLSKYKALKSQNKSYHIIVLNTMICLGLYAFSEATILFDFSFISIILTLLIVIIPCAFLVNPIFIPIKKGNSNEKKKIAFITTIYPNLDNKWYGIYLHDLAKNLIKLGQSVDIIYINDEKQNHVEEYDGVTIRYVPYRSNFLHKLMIPVAFKFKINFKCVLEENFYDVAIIHFYPPEMQSFMIDELHEAGIKVIQYLHSRNIFTRVEEKHPIYRKLYLNLFYERAYRKCDEIVCVSKLVKADLLKKVKLQNVHVIYNGVTDNYLDYPRNKFRRKHNNFNLLSVGNLISIKGHRFVIEALKILKEKHSQLNFKYTIVGNGMEKHNLEVLISKYKLNEYVEIKDAVSPDELINFYQSNDIFILPSYYEALGCVYLEAMNFGLITIGCEHQGISELNENCMILVEEKSVDDITNSLEKIMLNYFYYNKIALRGKKISKKYTWENSARQLIELL